ncbi:putative bifunctional diguanylate cyclase/phosphodiesterase [Tianweitania sediminis]|uniref:EAL domain-containing protein n=1 Tax=Tianweitania sediminis TaxID=1502156 RepID=A0A8J7R5S1_9HYPH|nr:EAL domain-containing protein [Tianweitania sediminis]MBP0438297.1 EAL domain-containing protein [Tianweitania sediminis]
MSLKIVQRLLAVVICCFVVVTCYISIVIFDRQAALQKVSRYNAVWTVSQALAEFGRLQLTLASYALPESRTSFDEVQLRLDIMFSRLDIFEEGHAAEFGAGRSLRQFVRNEPKNEQVIAQLRQALEAADARIMAEGAGFDVAATLRTLQPMNAEMVAMASRAANYGAARAAGDKAELGRLHMLFTGLAWSLIICGIVLIVLLVRQNKLLKEAHTKLSQTTAQLQESNGVVGMQNQRFDAALNNMSQALCTCDHRGQLVVFNKRFEALLGPDSRLQPGTNLSEALAVGRRTSEPSALQELYEEQMRLIQRHEKGSFTKDLRDGRSFSVAHEPLSDGGWLATYEDVSVRRQAEAHMLHMAHHDALTDLPNRVLLRKQLRARCLRSGRSSEIVAILLLDLDGFKEVNDTLGHHFGDELLKCVADRLRAIPEVGSVARLGGDEFAILMPPSCSAEDTVAIAKRVLSVLSEPYMVDGHEIVLSGSIGIAHQRQASCNPQELLKHADLAMYQAKADGRGRVCLFAPEMEARLHERKALEADLREALPRGEMELHYQPLLDAQTLEIAGFEALLRWKRQGREYVSPAEFIPFAEEIGLIEQLGEWVLEQACFQASKWPNHLFVAVNLSPVQFRQGNVVLKVLKALTRSGLLPQRLELEITESVLLEASDLNLAALNQLKEMGVRIALDDFGTGYSSLSYLSRFTFDKIKIDQTFIRDLPAGGHAAAVVEMIVDLGGRFGIKTTAEGVETDEQLHLLQQLGCSQVQGFLFARARLPGDLQFTYPRQKELLAPALG